MRAQSYAVTGSNSTIGRPPAHHSQMPCQSMQALTADELQTAASSQFQSHQSNPEVSGYAWAPWAPSLPNPLPSCCKEADTLGVSFTSPCHWLHQLSPDGVQGTCLSVPGWHSMKSSPTAISFLIVSPPSDDRWWISRTTRTCSSCRFIYDSPFIKRVGTHQEVWSQLYSIIFPSFQETRYWWRDLDNLVYPTMIQYPLVSSLVLATKLMKNCQAASCQDRSCPRRLRSQVGDLWLRAVGQVAHEPDMCGAHNLGHIWLHGRYPLVIEHLINGDFNSDFNGF